MTRRKSAGAQPANLTPKQASFVENYLIDLNATRAAIKAGYAPNNARKYAHQLMQMPHIEKAISAAFAARSERTRIDADWVLQRLAEEADADLADILDDKGAIKPVKDWPKVWRKGLVAGIDVQELLVEGVKVGQIVKLRLSDRIKRIELIGKHVNVQAFRDQVHQTGAITLNVLPEDAEL